MCESTTCTCDRSRLPAIGGRDAPACRGAAVAREGRLERAAATGTEPTASNAARRENRGFVTRLTPEELSSAHRRRWRKTGSRFAWQSHRIARATRGDKPPTTGPLAHPRGQRLRQSPRAV